MRAQVCISEEHLRGLPGLTRQAAAALLARQPTTVREALEIHGIGRRTTAWLLALGVLRDPDGAQGPPSKSATSKTTTAKRPSGRPQPKPKRIPWAFAPRFRRGAMGWRSKPAVQRVREAVAEIVREDRRDPRSAAEGAVLFLEKVSPALEQVDSSSGAIGTAVNRAVETFASIIGAAPADRGTREAWLERLWEAMSADEIPYLELLGDEWGTLCASPEVASAWADRLKPVVELAWSPDRDVRGYFKGTSACLSSLLGAGRYQEVLDLLEKAPHGFWHYRQFGFRALVAMGRRAEALRYAESSRDAYSSSISISRACEEILLDSGLADEAYRLYAHEANLGTSHLATYRAVAKKYPYKKPAQILEDLVARTPGEEGKWFAAAKDAGLYAEAIALARRSPCDPRTLTRAARDYATANATFALEAGMLALHWLVQGYGFEITGADVWAAHSATMRAAENAHCRDEARARLRALVARESLADRFVTKVLGRELGLS